MASDAFENVEGLETPGAAVVGFARSRAELTDALDNLTATAWARHRGGRTAGRGDAERFQPAPPLLTQPLARPGRREHRLDDHVSQVVAGERLADGALNDLGRGTARVG